MRTIADRLKADLEAAQTDIADASNRAAASAHAYIVRRLLQLERHFGRHRFVFEHRSGSELRCFPAIRGYHDVPIILRLSMGRATRWRCLRALFQVREDLVGVAGQIGRLNRLLGRIASDSRCPQSWWVGDAPGSETDYERMLVEAGLAAGDDDAAERMKRFDMGGVVSAPRYDRTARSAIAEPPPRHATTVEGRPTRRRRDDGTNGCGYF